MKSYKKFVASLPPKTIVFAECLFDPPTKADQKLIHFVIEYAKHVKANHTIFLGTHTNTKQILTNEQKKQYAKMLFPEGVFDTKLRSIASCTNSMKQKHANLIMIASNDNQVEFAEANNVKAIIPEELNYIDPLKMRRIAKRGKLDEFKKGLPTDFRDIDARVVLNVIRESYNVAPLKNKILLNPGTIREQYFTGKIGNVGDIVESNGQRFEVVKRGTNNIIVKDEFGNTINKWIQDLFGE